MSHHTPKLPFAGFPLRFHRNGQWYKSVWNSRTQRSEQFYFGKYADDTKGERAISDPISGWLARRPAILAGVDNVHVEPIGDVVCLSGPTQPVGGHAASFGEHVRQLMARGKSHLVAMTGSYFRGDAEAVLQADDESKFEFVNYTYYEQLNGYSARSHRRMCSAKDGSPMRPDFGNDFIGIDQVYAMLEVRPGPEQAMQFARRVNELNEATLALADRCCAYDGPGGTDIPLETMLVIDEARSDVKRHALGLARDMRVWASQLGAGTAGVKMTPQNTRMAKDEANIKARDFLRQHPDATSRELAAGVGCSTGLVSKLPAWKAVKEQRDKGRQPKKAGNIALTPKMEQVVGVEGDALAKLISEQKADAEPSPLVNDAAGDRAGAPRRAKIYRKS